MQYSLNFPQDFLQTNLKRNEMPKGRQQNMIHNECYASKWQVIPKGMLSLSLARSCQNTHVKMRLSYVLKYTIHSSSAQIQNAGMKI